MKKAFIITVGDELLLGQVVDSNSAWIGAFLAEHGVDLAKKVSVGDNLDEIMSAIDEGFEKSDIVLMTGGLGPTKDDITKQAIASYFNAELEFREDAYQRIKKFFEILNRPISDSHYRQSYFPKNAILLENKMGTAPGMLFYNGKKILISMPGVPFEMQYIMQNGVRELLKSINDAGEVIYYRTIHTAGESETKIEDLLQPIINELPEYIKIAYLPSLAQVRIRITGKHTQAQLIKEEVNKVTDIFSNLLGSRVYAYDGVSLEEKLLTLCVEKGLTLCTAESCTGGLISHTITTVPGSSDYFKGGVVSYSNELKMQILGVSAETIKNHGAVSEECVKEMAKGALKVCNANLSVAVSGVAGPGGGTPEKPVGTIWLAIANSKICETYLLKSGKNRIKNMEYATTMALYRILDFINRNYADQ